LPRRGQTPASSRPPRPAGSRAVPDCPPRADLPSCRGAGRPSCWPPAPAPRPWKHVRAESSRADPPAECVRAGVTSQQAETWGCLSWGQLTSVRSMTDPAGQHSCVLLGRLLTGTWAGVLRRLLCSCLLGSAGGPALLGLDLLRLARGLQLPALLGAGLAHAGGGEDYKRAQLLLSWSGVAAPEAE